MFSFNPFEVLTYHLKRCLTGFPACSCVLLVLYRKRVSELRNFLVVTFMVKLFCRICWPCTVWIASGSYGSAKLMFDGEGYQKLVSLFCKF